MSISSIHSLSSICSINHKSMENSLEQQFQKAFEELNTNLILQLLDQGANPNQVITFNQALEDSFSKHSADHMFNYTMSEFENKREGAIKVITYLAHWPENLKNMEDGEFEEVGPQELQQVQMTAEKARLILNDLEQKPSVSDETIYGFLYECIVKFMQCNCCDENPHPSKLSPLDIAATIDDETLIQKLIDAGAIPSMNENN